MSDVNLEINPDFIQLRFSRGNPTSLALLTDDIETGVGGNISGGGAASARGATSGGPSDRPDVQIASYTRDGVEFEPFQP